MCGTICCIKTRLLSLPVVGVACCCLLPLCRGMVDAEGKPHLSYPYAEDGLAIWRAMEKYFGDYLALYYGSGAEGDSKVAADEELQAFWKDVTVRHRRGAAEQRYNSNISVIQHMPGSACNLDGAGLPLPTRPAHKSRGPPAKKRWSFECCSLRRLFGHAHVGQWASPDACCLCCRLLCYPDPVRCASPTPPGTLRPRPTQTSRTRATGGCRTPAGSAPVLSLCASW